MLRSRSVQYIISGGRACKASQSSLQSADAVCSEVVAGGRGLSNTTGNVKPDATATPAAAVSGSKTDSVKSQGAGPKSGAGAENLSNAPVPRRSSKLLPALFIGGGFSLAAYYAYKEYPEQTKSALSAVGIDAKDLLDRLPDHLPDPKQLLDHLPALPSTFTGQKAKKATEPTDGWRFETAIEAEKQESSPTANAASAPEVSSQDQTTAAVEGQEVQQKIDASPLDQLLTDALTFTSVATVDEAVEDSKIVRQTAVQAEPSTAAASQSASTAAAPSTSEQSPPVPQPEVVLPLPKYTGPPRVQGVQVDLTPGGLVKYAVEHGQGPGADWKAYDAQLRQAKSDAVVIGEGLKQAELVMQEAVQQERDTTGYWKRKAEEMRGTSEQVVQRMKDIIRLQGQHHDLLLKDAVRQAKLEAMATAVDAITQERIQRISKYDAVREQANALGQTVELAGQAAQAAGQANRTAMSLMRLGASLQRGQPFARELNTVAKVAGGDPLVATATAALAGEGAEAGVPTREQLALTLARLKAPLGELATLPATGGGILSRLAAKVASSMKADEGQVVASTGLASTPDAALAAAEQLLASGKLAEAADVLEVGVKGTAAEVEAAGWVTAARRRVAVDVTAQLLTAHATAVAASLVA